MALNKLKSLFIYPSDKQDEGCLSLTFLPEVYVYFIAEDSILNTNVCKTSLLLVLNQLT